MSASLAKSAARALSVLAIGSWLLEPFSLYGASAQVVSTKSPTLFKSSDLTEIAFDVPTNISEIIGARLYYSTLGASNSTGLRRSVNGSLPFGGYVDAQNERENRITDDLDPRLVKKGANIIHFTTGDNSVRPSVYNATVLLFGKDSSGNISARWIEPRLSLTNSLFTRATYLRNYADDLDGLNIPLTDRSTKIKIIYPVDGSYFGSRALIRGRVTAGVDTRTSIRIGNQVVANSAGEFEAIVDRPEGSGGPWKVDVDAQIEGGKSAHTTVVLNMPRPAFLLSAPRKSTVSLRPGGSEATAFGLKVSLIEGDPQGITVRCNRAVESPAVDGGIISTVVGECTSYRLRRKEHGGRIRIAIPSSITRLPPGSDGSRGQLFKYDETETRWASLANSFVDIENKSTVGTLRDQTGTFVSGTIKLDNKYLAEPSQQSTKSLTDISNVAVLGGHVKIDAPQSNPFGSAMVPLPVLLRPQRGNLGPLFQISYDLSAGNGPVGNGISIDIPLIEVDTKWGVPAYDPSKETDSYTIGGKEIVAFEKDDASLSKPPYRPNRMAPRPRTDFLGAGKITEFRYRIDDTHDQIHRYGDSPANYWWEIIHKNGVHEFYGLDPVTGSPNNSVRKTENGSVFQWAKTRAIDLDSNTTEYLWNEDTCDALPVHCVSALLPLSILYNDHLLDPSGRLAKTQVGFSWRSQRPDKSVNGRHHVLQVNDARLTKLSVTYGADLKSTYGEQRFQYKISSFGKSLLSSVIYDVDPAGAGQIPDDQLIAHQCAPPSAPKFDLASINALGNRKRVICFDYYDPLKKEQATNKPFLDPETVSVSQASSASTGGSFSLINGVSDTLAKPSILGTMTSKENGGSNYFGFSFPAYKGYSIGFKTGGTQRDSIGRSALVDMDGDGIPDFVYSTGGQLTACRGQRDRPEGASGTYGVRFDGPCLPVEGLTADAGSGTMQELSTSFSIGAELFIVPAFAGAAMTESQTSRAAYFVDVDGDGLTDVVYRGQVYYNQGIRERNGQRFLKFDVTSSNLRQLSGLTASQLSQKQVDQTELAAKTARDAANRNRKYAPLLDIVHGWRAPADGVVVIGGGFLRDIPTWPGSVSPAPSDVAGSDRLIIERSRGAAVKTCFDAPLGVGPARLTCVDGTGMSVANAYLGILQIQSAPLPVEVKEGDVIYARTTSKTDAATPWNDLDIYVSYLSENSDECQLASPTQRPFQCKSR